MNNNTGELVNNILLKLSAQNILKQEDLVNAKMIITLCIENYPKESEHKYEVSTDVDKNQFYLEQFILNMKLRACTDGSIKCYIYELNAFISFIDKSVETITYQDINRYLIYGKIQRKWKDRTYNMKLIIIRTFFSFLYEEDFIKDNPGKKLHEAKVEHRIGTTINAYQREEIKCSCKNEREQALCEFLYSTGARVSEICSLNISDIDFQNMSAIVYGKGRKEREIYFNAPTKLHLEKYLQSRDDNNVALFVTNRKPHNRISPSTVRAILKQIKSRNKDTENIKLTPHVFRRTVGTDMINKGAPLEIVAEKLGHSKLDTTRQCYASISRVTVHNAHNRYIG
ncbi:hypothetical protein DS742_26250 [Lacrimispora amygdalina]|uniref:Integrase n=1 Tax=Lacrimispora amygdalina TaxID=253257 RepID=A0A3E2N4P6_9FIRM|nr:tyrosine-type recombinase/integrase [Clostridium indicum]RFZ75944.1 hypothetical protein DS742_26250 [Clostridium indicum]